MSQGNAQQFVGARRPSRLRRWLPPLIALAMTLALLEAGSYVYLRAFQGYDGEHLLNYRFDPYKNIALTPGYRDTRGITHNAQGFRRDEDTPLAKPEGTLRVFLMGGSTGYGLRSLSQHAGHVYPVIRNDETIDHYMEEILRDAVPGHRVEVINAAITSFQSHHHLIYLNQVVLKYEPDVIVFLDGFNDYYMDSPGFDQFRDYAYQERAHRFLHEPSLEAWTYYTGWWLFRKSHFAHVLGKAMRNVSLMLGGGGERPVIDVDQALRNVADNAERNFVKMVERNGLILAHEGVDAIFALQPEIAFEQGKEHSALEVLIYDEMVNHWPENYIPFKNAARPIVIDYMERANERLGRRVRRPHRHLRRCRGRRLHRLLPPHAARQPGCRRGAGPARPRAPRRAGGARTGGGGPLTPCAASSASTPSTAAGRSTRTSSGG